MLIAGTIVDVVFLIGYAMFIGGLRRARWWMVEDTGWWLLDSRKGVRKLLGERALRGYGIGVGVIMMAVSVVGLFNLWWK